MCQKYQLKKRQVLFKEIGILKNQFQQILLLSFHKRIEKFTFIWMRKITGILLFRLSN